MGKLRNYFLNHYPRTDFHELNQDWMISMLYDMINQVENFVEMNSVKYADPIQWDITRQYEKNTIVIDEITGTTYISSKPVPKGVALSRTEYWNVIFDLGRFITLASQNFANSYESVLTTTATMPTDKDKWVVWNSILYRAKNDIHVGDRYVIDGNIEKYTVEMFFDELAHLISEETEARIEADNDLHGEIVDESVARENADTTLQDNIDAEATARENADDVLQDNIDTLQDNINDEVTARENADSALNARLNTEVEDRITGDTNLWNGLGNLSSLTTVDKSNLVVALNEERADRQFIDNSIVNEINGIKKRIDRKIVVIGDSYGGQPTMDSSWIFYLKIYLGLTEGVNFFSKKRDGAGFDGNGFLTCLQELEADYPDMDRSSITDIIVCGGANDLGHTKENVLNGMQLFIGYTTANYAIANTHIGFIAMRGDSPQFNYNTMSTVLQWYKTAQQLSPKAKYIVDSEWIWHNYSYLQADGIHPTIFASEIIGKGLASYFAKGAVLLGDTSPVNVNLIASGYSTTMVGNFTEYYNGANVSLYFQMNALTNSFGNTLVEIGSYTPIHVKGEYDCRVLLPALINGTTFAMCEISFQNGKILAFPIGAVNVTSIQIIGTVITLPTIIT